MQPLDRDREIAAEGSTAPVSGGPTLLAALRRSDRDFPLPIPSRVDARRPDDKGELSRYLFHGAGEGLPQRRKGIGPQPKKNEAAGG